MLRVCGARPCYSVAADKIRRRSARRTPSRSQEEFMPDLPPLLALGRCPGRCRGVRAGARRRRLRQPRRARHDVLRREQRHGRRRADRSEEVEEPVDDRLHLHAGRGSRRLREHLQAVHDATSPSASTRRSCSTRCSRTPRRSRRCARAACTSAASRPGPTAFAVNLAGAVPFAVKGTAKEFQGYNLIVIVKASSPYQKLARPQGQEGRAHVAVVELGPSRAARAVPRGGPRRRTRTTRSSSPASTTSR